MVIFQPFVLIVFSMILPRILRVSILTRFLLPSCVLPQHPPRFLLLLLLLPPLLLQLLSTTSYDTSTPCFPATIRHMQFPSSVLWPIPCTQVVPTTRQVSRYLCTCIITSVPSYLLYCPFLFTTLCLPTTNAPLSIYCSFPLTAPPHLLFLPKSIHYTLPT
jgi:hypothetical protein